MVRAYDDNGNVVDLVKWEIQIRADTIDEFIDIVLNGYTFNQLNLDGLTFILKDAKNDFFKEQL